MAPTVAAIAASHPPEGQIKSSGGVRGSKRSASWKMPSSRGHKLSCQLANKS